MNEQKFSTRQAVSLMILFTMGQVFIVYNGSPAKADVWISFLMAYAVSVPLSFLFAGLMNVFPGKTPFDLQLELFGPVLGRAMMLLYLFYYLHISSLVIRDMTNFIQATSLANTPQFASALLIAALCIYAVKSGINTVARYAAIGLPVYIAMRLLLDLLSTTLPMDVCHLFPVLPNGFKPVLKSAIDLSAFPYADVAALPFVIQPLKKQKKARNIFLAGYAISTAVFLLIYIQNTLILGSNLQGTQYFPTYVRTGLIDLADFLQRLEVVSGALMFMGVFVKISVYLYVFSLGLSKLLALADYRKFAAPSGLLAVALSLFAYPNLLANLDFAANIYPWYALIFNVLFPAVILATALLRRRKLTREGRLPQPPPAGEETPVARQDGGIPQNPDKQPEPAR